MKKFVYTVYRGDEFSAYWEDYLCFEADSKEDLILKLLYLVEEKLKENKKAGDLFKVSKDERSNLKTIVYNERFYELENFLSRDFKNEIIDLEREIVSLDEWFEKNRGYSSNKFLF